MKHQKMFVRQLNVGCTLEIGDFRTPKAALPNLCGKRAEYVVKHPRTDTLMFRCFDHAFMIGMEKATSCTNDILIKVD